MIDVSGGCTGDAAAAFALSEIRVPSATSNLGWLILPSSADSHSDPLVVQMANLKYPPMHVGFGMFAAFSLTLFHRLLSSTLIGRSKSLISFSPPSIEWIKISMRLATFGLVEDMIELLYCMCMSKKRWLLIFCKFYCLWGFVNNQMIIVDNKISNNY